MKECFAYGSEKKCRVLKVKDCVRCKFYKTNEQHQIDQINSKKRAIEKGYYIISKDYEPKEKK